MFYRAGFRAAIVVVLVLGSLGGMSIGAKGQSSLGEAEFLVLGGSGSPFVHFYQREGDTLNKLSDLSSGDEPDGNLRDADWHPDSTVVAMGMVGGNNISLYKRDGTSFSRLPDPEAVEGSSLDVEFSPDGDILYATHLGGPGFTVYERVGPGNYSKINEPASPPNRATVGLAVHPGGEFVAVAPASPTAVTLYRWVDGSLVNLGDATVSPGDSVQGLEWSPDGRYLASGSAVGSPERVVWRLDGEDLTEIYSDSSSDSHRDVDWAADGEVLVWATDGGLVWSRVVDDVVDVMPDPAPNPDTSDRLNYVDFSDGSRSFLAAASLVSPIGRWFDNSGHNLAGLSNAGGVSITEGWVAEWSKGFTPRPTTTPGFENFEDQTDGLMPLSTWYKLRASERTACLEDTPDPDSGAFEVRSGGADNSSLMFRLDDPGSGRKSACFTVLSEINMCEVEGVGFDFKWGEEIPGDFPEEPSDQRLVWQIVEGTGQGDEAGFGIEVGGNGVVFMAGPEGVALAGAERFRETVFVGSHNTWYRAEISMNCAGGRLDIDIEGEGSATIHADFGEELKFENFLIQGGLGGASADTNSMFFDGLSISLVEEHVPSEFSEGVPDFMSGLGFQTVESEFLFSIILIGVSLVIVGLLTTLMGNSRIRAYLAWIASMGVGVFCVAVLNLEFWMFVVAVVLGGAVLAGTGPLAGLFVGDVSSKRGRAAVAGAGSEGTGEKGDEAGPDEEAAQESEENAQAEEPEEPSAPEPIVETSGPEGGGEQ